MILDEATKIRLIDAFLTAISLWGILGPRKMVPSIIFFITSLTTSWMLGGVMTEIIRAELIKRYPQATFSEESVIAAGFFVAGVVVTPIVLMIRKMDISKFIKVGQ